MDPAHLTIIAERFGLRGDTLRLIGRSQNEVFETADGSILRISHGRGRMIAQIEAELDWIDTLSRQGVAVCTAQRSPAGRRCECVQVSDTEYLAVRFHRASGGKVEQSDIDDPLYARLGRLTAQLHAASFDGAAAKKEPHRPMWYESRLLKADLAHVPAGQHEFHGAVERLIAELKTATRDELGLVHADISFSNVFIDGSKLTIFDFDNCEAGSIAQDFATVIYDSIYCRLLNRVPEVELAAGIQQRWNAFLNGYRSQRDLVDLDAEVLRKFLVLREAIIYTHYHRILDPNKITDAFRAGMEQMRRNVEAGVTPATVTTL